MSELPDVTIVVCTYNRAALLREALRSLCELDVDRRCRYEILVVDNASSDDTPRVIEDLARCSPVPLRGVREARPGIAYARNRGIQEAGGDWIAFFDDDGIADPDWLTELLRMAGEQQARCVGGAIRLVVLDGETRAVPPALERLLAPTGRGQVACKFTSRNAPVTCNLLVHQSVFAEIGLFDERLNQVSGEDTELFERMQAAGIDAWYSPHAVMDHITPAYRLSARYLRWMSLRKGWGTAQQTRWRRGTMGLLLMGGMRVGKAATITFPALVAARFYAAADVQLYRRCQLWFLQGFLRCILQNLAPNVFPQRDFYAYIELRGEREQFGSLQQPAQTMAGQI